MGEQMTKKRKINCVVCGGQLVAQHITINEDEDGADVEELDGYLCDDCGVKYGKLPKKKVVDCKEWETKILRDVGGE